MSGLRLIAPAKINLYLHVLGRNPDGLHALDSLVVFTELGDLVSVRPDQTLALEVSGPFANSIGPAANNLVMRAAKALAQEAGIQDPGARIELVKNLPPASGLGGGSSDAAAAIRLLSRLWNITLDPERAMLLALSLGADVPVCLFAAPAHVRGIGEQITPAPTPPPMYALLANPGIELPTGLVFEALAGRFGAAATPMPPGFRNSADFARWLGALRNDLQAPAIELAPQIGAVLDALGAQAGCLLARMSGSGATCFGLFAIEARMRAAALALKRRRPALWLAPAKIRGVTPALEPVSD